jgi:RNA recognition motif-containing protein
MKTQSSKRSSGYQGTNVFINYLPKWYTKAELVDLCSGFGAIISAKVMIDLETGYSKCFGFVRFAQFRSAEAAIKKVNGLFIDEKRLIAKFASSSEKLGEPTRTLFVKSLPLTILPEEVYQVFCSCGQIVGIKIESSFHSRS